MRKLRKARSLEKYDACQENWVEALRKNPPSDCTRQTVSVVGLQVSGAHARACTVDDRGNLTRISKVALPCSVDLSYWVTPNRLADRLARVLPEGSDASVLTLPGGTFQTRRVPLEVAEDVDQRSQVAWEVSQALSADEGAHSISYAVRGSSAVWVAIPNACIDGIAKAFAHYDVSFDRLCPGPIALAHALVRYHPVGVVCGVLLESSWVSRVELEDGNLVAASTSCPEDCDIDAVIAKWSETDADWSYIVGEPGQVERYRTGKLELLYPEADDANVDSVSTIAYGAALSVISESPI